MPALRRRPGITSVATLTGFVLTVGLAHLTAPEWSRAAGLDVWNAPVARADLDATVARGVELDVRNERILEQIRGSECVVDRVAAGHMTLAAAVRELEALNADRPGWADGLRASHWDEPSHRRRVARYVLGKLARRPAADPAAGAPRAAELQAEFRALGG